MFKPNELTTEGGIEAANSIRNQWMEELQRRGISTRPATHAVHMLSYYADKYGLEPTDFPNAKSNDCHIITFVSWYN